MIVFEILLTFSSWALKIKFSKIHEALVDVLKMDLNTYSTCTYILIPQALLFERLVKYLPCQKSSQWSECFHPPDIYQIFTKYYQIIPNNLPNIYLVKNHHSRMSASTLHPPIHHSLPHPHPAT